MFKLSSIATAMLATALATPFTGEFANERHLLRDDGGMAIRVEPKFAGSHKHEKMVSRTLNKKSSDPTTIYQQVS